MLSVISAIKYGRQIGKTTQNGSRAFVKENGADKVVTVIDKDGNLIKTLKSHIDVFWNGIISKTTSVCDSTGKRTDLYMSSFQPEWGLLKNSHYKYGDVKKEIISDIRIYGDKMSLKQSHYHGDISHPTLVKTHTNDDIKIANPNFRYGNCGNMLAKHSNKYANEIYKANGSEHYNEWIS